MIKKYTLLPLLLIAATFVYAQPQRKVLLTLKKGEILYYAEYASNMRINGHKFTCVLNDTLNDKKIFIHNGERKVTASEIYAYNINPISTNASLNITTISKVLTNSNTTYLYME